MFVKLGHGKFNQDSFSVFTVLGSNHYDVALMPNCEHNVVFIKGTEESAKKRQVGVNNPHLKT